MFKDLIQFIDSKSVLILGFGREGRSTYDVIRRHLPEKEIGIGDIRDISLSDEYVKLHCGPNYMDAMKDYEVVIKTPGVSFKGVRVPEGTVVTCQTDLFMHFSDCLCVGITGTKGKTTVATLVYDMLKKGGKNATLVGSIGVPVLDSLEDKEPEIAVVEMSSHQLEYTTASPQIAVITNIYPEHPDHYNGFNGYVSAKMNIAKHQTSDDYLICNAVQNFDNYCDFSSILSTVIKTTSYSPEYAPFIDAAEKNPHLIGRHNKQNVTLAVTVAKCLGIDDSAIVEAIGEFKGIEHRLEPVGIYKNIFFYEDVTATIPVATECAVEALKNVDTLIFGGQDVGVSYSEFEDFLSSCNVRNLIGLPDIGREICADLANKGCRKNLYLADDMEDAVKTAFSITEKGKTCLMSPASSSYNVYKNFDHKGNHFKELVKKYGTDNQV